MKKVFIIAELSANHNHKYDLAVKTIKAAAEAGADAIKVQTYTADTITIKSNKKYFQINQGTIWDGTTLYELYQQAYTPWEWQPKLKEVAENLGLVFFSSPFDKTAVDFLEEMDVPLYKVASFELVDIPLIEYIASKGKPMIMSTGIATLEDIQLAVETCKKQKNNNIALLKCTSAYPTPMEDLNLRVIPDLIKKFNTTVGLSDHTMGSTAAVASVALGAKIIEKHLILDRKMGGPDSQFSMEPSEFKSMVQAVRDTEKALGKVTYKLTPKMKKSREHSRSLFVVKDIKKGEKFTKENVRSIRPGFGIHPKYYHEILGKRAVTNIETGTPLDQSLIQK